MTASTLLTPPDPLLLQPAPERPAYATGQLLDVQDFSDEQTYHRGRLARALGALAGNGTLAGLRAGYAAASATMPEEIRIEPGYAVDRLGRLIEIPRPACTRLQRWFEGISALDAGDTLRRSAYDNLGRFASSRAQAEAALPARAVVADVFIRFLACPRGFTPAFAAGPFDALNAVSTSRLRDAYELQLLARTDLDDAHTGLPAAGADLAAIADPTARKAALQDAIFNAWSASGHASEAGALPPASEHLPAMDTTAVWLARLFIPVTADTIPQRDASGSVLVDNYSRRFVPAQPLLARWIGAA